MEFDSSSSKLQRMYNVLINFNGEDIRRKFVSHLDFSLSRAGFTTFLHEENVLKGMQLQEQQTQAKEMCLVAIVLFTKTYAESAWCLHELQQIIKCHETCCQHVLPVYYEIQPSDVRLQKGDFGKALKATAQQTFSGQQVEYALYRWSRALTKAANFFGWDESNYRSDAELVDKIVKSVLNLPILSTTKFPVGLQSHVENVTRMIENKASEVSIIGIWGMGGLGKTTIVKAIYNQIHGKFIDKSFIEDITEISQTKGYVHLQEQLLSNVLKTKVEIHSVEMGTSMIQERLSGKRVLIVLDGVNELDSLHHLCRSRDWFGKGTVIIITTRSEYLLRISQVDSVFQTTPKTANESLELLSWHAFREAKPKEEYDYLARNVVRYCRGLPLALEVIGSYLFERKKKEWESVLLKFHTILNGQIQEILKISYDALHHKEKNVFLDVCFFFIGNDRDCVTEILNGCGLNAGIGIKILIKRNLIKVEKNNKLGMHPLLQVMGREIILQSSTQEFEKRYRLCFPGDLKCVVTRNVRREVIQGLVLKSPLTNTSWSKIPAFNVMNTLTVWDDIYEELTGDYPNLSKQLRWICHRWFPLKYIPENYDMEGVIAIDLKWSNLRLVWKEPRVLGLLKFLNLSHSKYLTETPDFSGLPSLEQLILKDCPRLCKVHQSIGDLCNLLLINLKDCTSLRNLPREVYKLKSLKTLILSGCSKIDIWEDDVAQMESLITLIAENKAVKQVPLSIVSSKCIGYISLRGFEGSSHNLFPSILRSWIPPMNPLCDLHPFSIDMEDNSSGDLVPFLSSLANLRCVLVQCDTEFQLRKQVEAILVKHGINFTELGVSKHHLRSFLIGVGSYNEFFNILSNSIFEGLASSESCDVSLPDDNRPYWLAHVGEGHSVYFTLPQDCYVKGMALCVVYLSPPEIMETECLTSVLIVNYTKCTFQIHKHGTVICFNDIDWEGIISNLGSGDKVEIFVTLAHGFVVKNTAVYLMCNEPNNSEMEPCKQPKENAPNKFIKKIVMCDFKLLLFFKNRK